LANRKDLPAATAAATCTPLEKDDGFCGGPQVEVSDRVVWLSDTGPEYGVVRWIGHIPGKEDFLAGIEFVSLNFCFDDSSCFHLSLSLIAGVCEKYKVLTKSDYTF
jgi:hypothetical protein